MAIAEVIPANLMRPDVKPQVIDWLRDTQLPSRFRRRLLQEWAEALGVELTGADYEAVVRTGA
jgi:hypothetical protein